jgi:hypothetical protein
MPDGLPMLMDKAYGGNETRQLVLDLGMVPVVPPKSNQLDPGEYDHELYKKSQRSGTDFPQAERHPPHLLQIR